ncbi:FeoC-like transcriptional regulator [Endozoicomonas sp. 8E]|uniref:FeoC-like transcriptional regulator n=1 Tax=Endozoicomonas sp. 8E TaxID=3035692 RepID=UPI0029391777|nr:FeoC-like transcriptional regulator [Endozoicomonas sp. 8E]WOG30201.1 FeoC-like transcriptional regulator [Endozoicomonas sp. 8E]
MLLLIRDFLSEKGICTLAELSQHFEVDPEAMKAMLSHWVRKGKVVEESSGCKQGCVSCGSEQLIVYRWLNSSQYDLIPVFIQSD